MIGHEEAPGLKPRGLFDLQVGSTRGTMVPMDTTTYLNHTIEIIPDEDAESPRDAYSNLGIVVGSHGRHRIGGQSDVYNGPSIDFDDFEDWDEVEAHLRSEHGVVQMLPVYMIDHSGTAYSTAPFSCSWDSGQVGFIIATEDTIKDIGTPHALVDEALTAEVAEWSRWAQGYYVGYTVTNANGEVIDSCWGIDDEEYAMTEAKATVDDVVRSEAAQIEAWATLCAGDAEDVIL